MAITKTKNMGNMDRILRTGLGGLILLKGLLTHKKLEAGLGAAFMIYGITGFDPMLKLFGTSTIIGAEDNLLHQLKQATPGKGINPRLTEQALPRKETMGINPELDFNRATTIE